MAIYQKYNVWNEGQSLFDTTISGLWWFAKIVFKLLIYLPLIFTGYIIATKFLDKNANGVLWIAAILLIAFVLYLFMYFLKGAILVFKFHRNLLWLPLLFVAVSFTCIFPVWITWDASGKIISDMHGDATMRWIFAFACAMYIYYRYNFLTNVAPTFAFPAYDAGIRLTAAILKNTSSIRATRSRETI